MGTRRREKSGYLDVKLPSKLKGFGWTSWRRRWVMLHQLTDLADNKSIIRMTFYSSEEGAKDAQTPQKGRAGDKDKGQTLYIEDVRATIRIRSKTKLFAFTVRTGSLLESGIYLAARSETEAQDWIHILSCISSSIDSDHELDIGEVYHEALVIDNESSQRIHLTGRYLMVVSLNALSVYSCQDGSLCHEWRLNHLLRFYVDDHTMPDDKNKILVIIAGRGSPSGAGMFSFFFHNADTQEVISLIASSIQRTSTRRESNYHLTESIAQHQSEYDKKIKRSGSCGLPSFRNNGSFSVDVEHKRQFSMPYELERAIFIKSSSITPTDEAGKQSRRSTIISRSSVKSDDNGKSCKLLRQENKESDSIKNVELSSSFNSQEASNDKKPINIAEQKLLNNESNLHGIREDEPLFVVPNYFRRPSWFSDTTSPDVESSSSEGYHERTIKQCPSGKGFTRRRPSARKSMSTASSAHVQKASSVEVDASFSEYSANEADDEVDDDNEEDMQKAITRKTSAGSHLYQELPETYNLEEHTHCFHCKLCHKPPRTPPELPPRYELKPPRPRYNSDSVCSKHGKTLTDLKSRERSASENQKVHTANKVSQPTESTDDRNKRNINGHSSIKGQRGVTTESKPKEIRRKRSQRSQDEYPKKKVDQIAKDGQGGCQTTTSANNRTTTTDSNSLRKVSVLSGVYQDIEDVPSDSADATEAAQPPALPPRCKCEETNAREFKDDQHYEDLDRYRKNLQKYFGIPLSEMNRPPPLPSRPLSLPAACSLGERTRCRLKNVVRRRKMPRTSSESKGLSTETPTDDSASVNMAAGLHRVPAWPLEERNENRKRQSSTTQNSIYSLQDGTEGSNEYYTDGNSGYRYVKFQCATCGAANQVYSSPPQTFRPGSFPPTISQLYPPHDAYGIPAPFNHLMSPGSAPWYVNQPMQMESAHTESMHHLLDSVDSDIQSTYGSSETASRSKYDANIAGGYHPKADDLPEADNDIYTDMSGADASHYLSMDSLKLDKPKEPDKLLNEPLPKGICSDLANKDLQPKEPIYVNWPPRTYKDLK